MHGRTFLHDPAFLACLSGEPPVAGFWVDLCDSGQYPPDHLYDPSTTYPYTRVFISDPDGLYGSTIADDDVIGVVLSPAGKCYVSAGWSSYGPYIMCGTVDGSDQQPDWDFRVLWSAVSGESQLTCDDYGDMDRFEDPLSCTMRHGANWQSSAHQFTVLGSGESNISDHQWSVYHSAVTYDGRAQFWNNAIDSGNQRFLYWSATDDQWHIDDEPNETAASHIHSSDEEPTYSDGPWPWTGLNPNGSGDRWETDGLTLGSYTRYTDGSSSISAIVDLCVDGTGNDDYDLTWSGDQAFGANLGTGMLAWHNGGGDDGATWAWIVWGPTETGATTANPCGDQVWHLYEGDCAYTSPPTTDGTFIDSSCYEFAHIGNDSIVYESTDPVSGDFPWFPWQADWPGGMTVISCEPTPPSGICISNTGYYGIIDVTFSPAGICNGTRYYYNNEITASYPMYLWYDHTDEKWKISVGENGEHCDDYDLWYESDVQSIPGDPWDATWSASAPSDPVLTEGNCSWHGTGDFCISGPGNYLEYEGTWIVVGEANGKPTWWNQYANDQDLWMMYDSSDQWAIVDTYGDESSYWQYSDSTSDDTPWDATWTWPSSESIAEGSC